LSRLDSKRQLFVAAVVAQEALAGELRHLFADQALFVEAVTQTFLRGGGVDGQGVEKVVGAEPLAVVGKT
jgi:hypothetical protein